MSEMAERYAVKDERFETTERDWDQLKSNDDVRHVREMTEALEQNTLRASKAVEALAHRIAPVLMPANVTPDDDSAPTPVRCPLADDLAKANDRLYHLVRRIEGLAQSVDI